MLFFATSIFTIGAIVISVAGAVFSAIVTYQQGKEAQRVAEANANLKNQEAKQQMLLARIQENLDRKAADAELAAAEAEATASRANATALDEETRAKEAQSRENMRRKREAARSLAASNENEFVAAGIEGGTGTALAVLSEAVMRAEAEVIGDQYMTNVERTKSLWEANVERSTAGRIDATARAQHAISVEASKVRGIATRIGARNLQSQAEIDREAGRRQRKIATTAAIGQGVSGVASAVG